MEMTRVPNNHSSSSDHSSSSASSGHEIDPDISEPLPRTNEDIRQDQDQAMDDFMDDWFHGNEEEERAARLEHRPANERAWKQAEEHARTPVYTGACLSKLFAILGLMNLQVKHQASNAFMTDLFAFCHDLQGSKSLMLSFTLHCPLVSLISP